MADLVEKYLENNRIQLILRNFFQLNVEVLDAELVSTKFTLLHNRSVIDSITTRTGKCSFNLDSYGKYAVIAEFPENGCRTRLKAERLGSMVLALIEMSNLTKKIAILGISSFSSRGRRAFEFGRGCGCHVFLINSKICRCRFWLWDCQGFLGSGFERVR